MSFLIALGLLVGLFSSGLSIYAFFQHHQRRGTILAIIAACLLVGAFFLGNVPALMSSNGTSASNGTSDRSTPPTNTLTQETGFTPTPTQVPPTQVPSPTPTSPPSPGTVLYQADSSWSGWSGTKEWHIGNGMLINDGTGYPGQPTILAPDILPVSDYAVEASIQVVNWPRCCYSQFALVVRASTNSDGGWQGYSVGEDLEERTPSTANIAADAGHIGPPLASAPFDPGSAWHIYRVEIKGNTIKLLIDGGVKIDTTDNTNLSGGQVGLWSQEVQLNIRSFKIIAL